MYIPNTNISIYGFIASLIIKETPYHMISPVNVRKTRLKKLRQKLVSTYYIDQKELNKIKQIAT